MTATTTTTTEYGHYHLKPVYRIPFVAHSVLCQDGIRRDAYEISIPSPQFPTMATVAFNHTQVRGYLIETITNGHKDIAFTQQGSQQ